MVHKAVLAWLKRLYWTGEDDPSELKTMAELKEEYDSYEIAGMENVVKRGDFFIELP